MRANWATSDDKCRDAKRSERLDHKEKIGDALYRRNWSDHVESNWLSSESFDRLNNDDFGINTILDTDNWGDIFLRFARVIRSCNIFCYFVRRATWYTGSYRSTRFSYDKWE